MFATIRISVELLVSITGIAGFVLACRNAFELWRLRRRARRPRKEDLGDLGVGELDWEWPADANDV